MLLNYAFSKLKFVICLAAEFINAYKFCRKVKFINLIKILLNQGYLLAEWQWYRKFIKNIV